MTGRVHFIGIGGAGMSALALALARRGVTVSGSDRDRDRGRGGRLFDSLQGAGVTLHPQDASGLPGPGGQVVVSGAVEESVPDLAAARAAGLPIRHRAELLAELLADGRAVAVAGTSGKSTVTAMIAWILREAGLDPTFLGGASLSGRAPAGDGVWPAPAAWAGGSGLIVAEADESDGSLLRYRPEVAVITNLSHDHRPLAELRSLFRGFAAAAASRLVIHAERAEQETISTAPGVSRDTFGLGAGAAVRPEGFELESHAVRFRLSGRAFRLPLPGRCNLENALAAVAAGRHFGVADAVAARALERFPGLARRMELIGETRGVEVIDDFAHNPDKVAAALAALAVAGRPLRVLFQLHGFGPAHMHRRGLVEAFAAGLRRGDGLLLLPVYYAGGTAHRRVTEADYAADLRAAGVGVRTVARTPSLPGEVAARARPGDRIVVMGARDPSLPELARQILAALGRPAVRTGGFTGS